MFILMIYERQWDFEFHGFLALNENEKLGWKTKDNWLLYVFQAVSRWVRERTVSENRFEFLFRIFDKCIVLFFGIENNDDFLHGFNPEYF